MIILLFCLIWDWRNSRSTKEPTVAHFNHRQTSWWFTMGFLTKTAIWFLVINTKWAFVYNKRLIYSQTLFNIINSHLWLGGSTNQNETKQNKNRNKNKLLTSTGSKYLHRMEHHWRKFQFYVDLVIINCFRDIFGLHEMRISKRVHCLKSIDVVFTRKHDYIRSWNTAKFSILSFVCLVKTLDSTWNWIEY